MAAKTTIARAAIEASWDATVEHRSADGAWTAGVLAEKGGRRIALEV